MNETTQLYEFETQEQLDAAIVALQSLDSGTYTVEEAENGRLMVWFSSVGVAIEYCALAFPDQ